MFVVSRVSDRTGKDFLALFVLFCGNLMQIPLRQQIVKQARRCKNGGNRIQNRGKGLKIGAKPETAGATAHASGAEALDAGAVNVNVGATVLKSGAGDF
jgi:hypothetical protein